MCGIIAYTGKQQAMPVLLDGLRRLEYRGYDSAGISIHQRLGRARLHLHPGVVAWLGTR